MKVKQYSLAALETLINKLISLDTITHKNLDKLENKEIAIEIIDLNFTIYALCKNSILYLNLTQQKDKLAVKISSYSKNYLKLLLLRNNSDNAGNSAYHLEGINISGDLDTAKNLQDIIFSLEIDWEEQLSLITGDIAAHQIGNFVRSSKKQLKTTADNLQEMITEYIHHEANLAPNKLEVNQLLSDVDDLRDATDRLEARINTIK